MVHEMVQQSYLLFVAAITFIIFTCLNSVLTSEKRRHFLMGAGIAMLMVICNVGVYSLEGSGDYTGLLGFFIALSYSISGPVMIPLIELTAVIKRKTTIILECFALFNTILSFVSIFTEWYYTISEDGIISYNKMIVIPYILTVVYLTVLFYSSLIKYRLGFRTESIFLIWLAISTVVAVILNFVFKFKFLVSGMAVLSSIFYYIYFATQTLTRDALTNALNRHSFYKDIQTLSKKDMFIVSMDLNGLKQINDTLGHDEGDKAILAVSRTTFELLPSKCRFYRMGGDEFQILYIGADKKTTDSLCRQLKDKIKEKGYGVAFGFCEYCRGDDFEECLHTADELMYKDKARMKKSGCNFVRKNTDQGS